MAVTLTRYLKLRVDSGLTANSKYNLERIDTLAANLASDTAGVTNLRSAGDITIEPNSPALDGSGVGGSVSIGTAGHSLAEILLRADKVLVSGLGANSVVFTDGDAALTSAAALPISMGGTGENTASAAINALLPSQAGNAGKVLLTDGNTAGWVTVNVTSTVATYETNWLPSDGNSKTVTHNLGNADVVVSIRDTGDNRQLGVDIQATTDNTIVLTSSESPPTVWRVLVQASA